MKVKMFCKVYLCQKLTIVTCEWGQFINYIHKTFRKTNISDLLLGTHRSVYQRIRNINFLESFAYALNG